MILSGGEDFADVVKMRSYCSKVQVSQSCLTLCDPMDYVVHGILQATILEGVAVGIEPRFPALQADSLPTEL